MVAQANWSVERLRAPPREEETWGCERSLPRGRGPGLGPGHTGTFCVQRGNPPASVSHSAGSFPLSLSVPAWD